VADVSTKTKRGSGINARTIHNEQGRCRFVLSLVDIG
jgi:hypothetical protein